jgi:hypothetical protein
MTITRHITLTEFYEMLRNHDWFHMMSDDSSIDTKGRIERQKLDEIAKQSPEHKELLENYHRSVWDRIRNPDKSK